MDAIACRPSIPVPFLPTRPRRVVPRGVRLPGRWRRGGSVVAVAEPMLREEGKKGFDSGWKERYERNFERRFRIPHLTDVFPDLVPIPSTFSVKSRKTLYDDFSNGYPSDKQWNAYINNNDRVLLKVIRYSSPTSAGAECIDPDCSWVEQWVHRAGPRDKIYFRPEEVNAAIVTCGGLCPGLNDVIRQIVITLEIYGVKKIFSIPFGYKGFSVKEESDIPLSRSIVENIHLGGGSALGVFTWGS